MPAATDHRPADPPTIDLVISREGSRPVRISATLPVELGRIDPTRREPDQLFAAVPCDGGTRIAIAERSEVTISRRQVVISAGQPLQLTNASGSIAIERKDGGPVSPGATIVLHPPDGFRIGRVQVDVLAPSATAPAAITATIAHSMALTADTAGDVREFVHWWRRVIEVLQSASSSTDFFHKAAAALVDLVGLDFGAVFLRHGEQWTPGAISTRLDERPQPSTNVLGQVLAERRTVWNGGARPSDVFASMAALEAYVAAPILDGTGRVLGVLYGHRRGDPATGGTITELETLLVEALASGVGVGLARMEQEALAVRQRVTFSQFFSPELAARLESEPDLLRGRDAEITVMFCDIRGFSGVSERLGPAQTMDWIGDVLSEVSDQVVDAGGVLVDYVGDEVMAMWGAPTCQPDHATLAAAAARAIMAALPRLDARWSSVVGGPTRVGIGINSTTARVGNTGSKRKFKYGPLGGGVNIASRVRGATKFLKVDALLTGATRRLLDPAVGTRRLCTLQVVNIEEPLEIHELDCGPPDRAATLFPAYEEALMAFEAGEFSRAARLLGGLLDAFPDDGPALLLLSRAVDALVTEPADFSPVWRLSAK